jgi:uncharacterized protein (DUF2236 family)
MSDGFDLTARVPRGGVPAPQWVTRDSFDEQLARVHREVPDPIVGLYGPDSMMWRIGRCHLASMLGSGRALLLQVAHPWVTQGVDHHSRTRTDPIGRARRTFINVLSITFGSLEQALAAAERVHNVHKHIRGALEYSAGGYGQGEEYRANEVNALIWVHATLWDSAMRMYELIVEPVSAADKERYYEETKLFALLFGIPELALPPDWGSFLEYNERMWESDQLAVTPAALNLTKFLFKPLFPGLGPLMRWMEMVTAATLPPRLRHAFELQYSDATPQQFERTVARMRRLQRALPEHLRYSPTYYEAVARIEGRRSDLLTRIATRATLGRWRLVS